LRAQPDPDASARPASARPPGGAVAPDPPPYRALLHRYAALFNARDWDALRALIAEDCRLDLVSRLERRGAAVGEYFARYADLRDIRVASGILDDGLEGGRLALGIYSPRASLHPTAFALIEWRGERVTLIRDFRYVPYLADEVRLGRAHFRPDADDADDDADPSA
jgi:RNA polymerase sigma-70 factor (ECF subfamily)